MLNNVKLLGNSLKFHPHIANICLQASKNVPLFKIAKKFEKHLFKELPLLHGREIIDKKKHKLMSEMALRMLYDDYFPSFDKLLAKVTLFRCSRPEVFCKKGFLRKFAKFTRKQLCQSLFFNKVAGLGCFYLFQPSSEDTDFIEVVLRRCSSIKVF